MSTSRKVQSGLHLVMRSANDIDSCTFLGQRQPGGNVKTQKTGNFPGKQKFWRRKNLYLNKIIRFHRVFFVFSVLTLLPVEKCNLVAVNQQKTAVWLKRAVWSTVNVDGCIFSVDCKLRFSSRPVFFYFLMKKKYFYLIYNIKFGKELLQYFLEFTTFNPFQTFMQTISTFFAI